jgi:hypothetical protein
MQTPNPQHVSWQCLAEGGKQGPMEQLDLIRGTD